MFCSGRRLNQRGYRLPKVRVAGSNPVVRVPCNLTSNWRVIAEDNSTADEAQNVSVESEVGGQPTCYGANSSATRTTTP